MHSYDISRIYMAFFLPFVHIFFMKKSGTYVKKTCQYIMKKVMIMIEFFTICTWFCYVIISTNFWKNKINKKCTTCEKKKHKYLSWKSRIFFGVLAPIYLIIKYHNFLQKKYGFLGVGFLLRRGRGGWIVHYTRRDFFGCSAVFLPFAETS